MARSQLAVEFIDRLVAAEEVGDVLEVMHQASASIGGDKFSYHTEIMFEGIASNLSENYAVGYPQEWVDNFCQKSARLIDPVPDITMRRGKPTRWNYAFTARQLNQAELGYVAEAKRLGLTSGVGFPLWGPSGHNAYVGVGFPEDLAVPVDTIISTHHVILAAGHNRICELTVMDNSDLALSQREREVLIWVGRGKSNSDIATILSISADTVATYMRRIYTKLDCHDRIGAVIKALRLGLIHI